MDRFSLSDGMEGAWVEICRFRAPGESRDFALVLTAVGIDHRLIQDENGVAMIVGASDVTSAVRELTAYMRENSGPLPVAPPPAISRRDIQAALIYCVVLVVLFRASNNRMFSLDWVSAGAAQTGHFADGEWWRVFTALGLHADVAHLAGNMVLGALLGVFLSQLLGPGLAWLAILLAGGGGNALSLVLQPVTHTAIGASTAVFAALGILAVLMLRRQRARWSIGLRWWLPLAAGVTLLGFIGFGSFPTDVVGHIAGFAVGCLYGAGLLAAGPGRLPVGNRPQNALGAAAFGVMTVAWLIALGAPGI